MMYENFVFIGNRFSVLNVLLKNGCDIRKIFAVPDSYLSRELEARGLDYHNLSDKESLVSNLLCEDYDILVSNGCPYVLPISRLNDGKRKFINVHPSLLPDMKGKHPINGAILFGRKHGVTCHYMDDGIDTGDIIEQIEIPVTDDINLDLLYKMSFKMEGVVFEKAMKKGFQLNLPQPKPGTSKLDYVYYSRKPGDFILKEDDNIRIINRKVRAFSSSGMYAKVKYKNRLYPIKELTIVDNPCALFLYGNQKHNRIVEKYGTEYILVKFCGKLLQFNVFDNSQFKIGNMFIEK